MGGTIAGERELLREKFFNKKKHFLVLSAFFHLS